MITPTRTFQFVAAMSVAFALSHGIAKADIYNVTLTPTSGVEGGTGSFTVNGPVPSTGLFAFGTGYSGPQLMTAMDFVISEGANQYTFDLSKSVGNPYGEFLNGGLYDLTYEGTIVNTGAKLDLVLQENGLEYVFSDIYNASYDSSGIISAVRVPAAVPEPQSLALLATMLVILAVVARKARRIA